MFASFTFFLQETFAPYLSFSYGYVDADLFHNSNDSYIIKGQGHTTNINVGFNIIKPLKHKSYKLLYGLEVNFDDIVKKVASKNGTTEKALNFLKIDNNLSLLITQAIYKAEKRSREISKDLL